MKNFRNAKKAINISQEKKAMLWEKIETKVDFYKNNVIISENESLNKWEAKKSLNLFNKKKNMIATIIALLTLTFAGGTTLAAETSLPWDVLYPVKIYINENIKSALAIWSENEAQLQLNLIEDKLHEKEELKAKWKLDIKAENEIEDQIQEHKDTYEKERIKLKKNNKTEATVKLEAKLNKLLEKLILSTNSGATIEISNNGDIKIENKYKDREQEDYNKDNKEIEISPRIHSENKVKIENKLNDVFENTINVKNWAINVSIWSNTKENNHEEENEKVESETKAWVQNSENEDKEELHEETKSGTNVDLEIKSDSEVKVDDDVEIKTENWVKWLFERD